MKPALLLDVDGVLCPISSDPPEGYSRHQPGINGYDGLWVWIGAENTKRLARLREAFDLLWATSWEDHANVHLLDLHGLEDPLPVIGFHENGEIHEDLPDDLRPRFSGGQMYGGHWKLPWIASYGLRESRPFAWVDDEIGDRDKEWAAERTEAGTPTLFLQTDYCTGLEDTHVDQLLEFASSIK